MREIPGRTFPVETLYLEDAVQLSGYTVEEKSPFRKRARRGGGKDKRGKGGGSSLRRYGFGGQLSESVQEAVREEMERAELKKEVDDRKGAYGEQYRYTA